MFRLLKGLGRSLSGLSTAGVTSWIGYSVRACPRPRGRQSLSSFSTDVPGKRNWSAAGGCGQAGLGAGALALCSYLGTEMEERVHLCPAGFCALGTPLPGLAAGSE